MPAAHAQQPSRIPCSASAAPPRPMSIQPVLEVGTSSHACLKDLCSQDKKKVSNLIKQVVELKQERVILQQQLQQAHDGQAGLKDKLSGLTETNKDLVREMASLKAKLVNAVTLLRIYQHKVQVLEASLAHVHSGHHAGALAAQPAAAALQPTPGHVGANGPLPSTAPPALMAPQQAGGAPSCSAAPPTPAHAAATSTNRDAPQHPHPHLPQQRTPQENTTPQRTQHPPRPQPHPLPQPWPAAPHPASHLPQQQPQQPPPGPHPTSALHTTPTPAAAATSPPRPASSQRTHQPPSTSLPPITPQSAPGTPPSPAGDCAASEQSLLTDSPGDVASVHSQPSPCHPPSPAPQMHPLRRPSGAAQVTQHSASGATAQRELLALAQVISNIAKTINPATTYEPLLVWPQQQQQHQPQHRRHHHHQLHQQRPSTGAAGELSASSSSRPAPPAAHRERNHTGSSSERSQPLAAAGAQPHASRSGALVGAEHSRRDTMLGADQDMHQHGSHSTARKLDLAAGSTSSTSSLDEPSFWNGDTSTQQESQSWADTGTSRAAQGNPVESLADLIFEMEELDQEPWCGSARNSFLAEQMGRGLLDLELVEENDVLAIIAAQEGVFTFS